MSVPEDKAASDRKAEEERMELERGVRLLDTSTDHIFSQDGKRPHLYRMARTACRNMMTATLAGVGPYSRKAVRPAPATAAAVLSCQVTRGNS